MSKGSNKLRVLKSLANESRLQIIQSILSGTQNPGDIARALGRHRSTVEKHLRVLFASGIVQKTPGLDEEGHLQVQYTIRRGKEPILREMLQMAENMSTPS